MLVADEYLGHEDEQRVADRLAEADPATVVLTDTERRRSRVRTETADGRDLGVVVARDLGDGDVLVAEDTLVVVELAAVEALVVELGEADVPPLSALELGHALGNRHWDLAVRGDEALFPVPDTRARMDATVAEVLPDGVETRYESVPPTTFDDAGGDLDDEHHHGADDHSHAHGDSDHAHGHDHTHTHEDTHSGGIRTIDEGDR